MAEELEVLNETLEPTSGSSSRIAAYREALWRPLMWLVDGALLLLAYGDLLARVFPITEENLRKVAILSSLPWYWKAIVFLAVNVALIAEGAFRAIRKRERQRDDYFQKLKQIEDTKPRIVLREPGAIHIQEVKPKNRMTGVVTGVLPFVKVRFINKPLGAFPNSIARSISAKISFYGPDAKLLLEMNGRWDDSDEPSSREAGKSRNDLLGADFGIEQEHGLDIAFKDPTFGHVFAFNSDNYDDDGFRKAKHLLLGTEFRVDIKLVGAYVDEAFSFQFASTQDGLIIGSKPQPL